MERVKGHSRLSRSSLIRARLPPALNGQPSGQEYCIIGASGKPISNAVKGRKKQIRVNLHRVGDTYEEGGAAEENNNFE